MVSPNIHICRKDQRRTPQRRWCHCVIFNLTISQSCSCFVRGTIVRIWVFREVTIFNSSSIKIVSWERITSSWILGSSPYAVIMFRKLISVHAFDYVYQSKYALRIIWLFNHTLMVWTCHWKSPEHPWKAQNRLLFDCLYYVCFPIRNYSNIQYQFRGILIFHWILSNGSYQRPLANPRNKEKTIRQMNMDL